MKKRIPTGVFVILFALGLPIIVPVACILHLLRKHRLRKLVLTATCQTCGKTLGLEALRLADVECSALVAELHKQHPLARLCLVRTLHAICPHCGTRYTYFEKDNEFRIKAQDRLTRPSRATSETAPGATSEAVQGCRSAASPGERKMTHLKPPSSLDFERTRPSVFLAGSIEQGTAEDWQTTVAEALREFEITVLNPRRDSWDATWRQDREFAPFREQVEWELEAQEKSDLIAFYFSPSTRSPVTLLELGLAAGRRQSVVCCPEGYWRRGNVDIVCARYGIAQVATLDDLVQYLRVWARPN